MSEPLRRSSRIAVQRPTTSKKSGKPSKGRKPSHSHAKKPDPQPPTPSTPPAPAPQRLYLRVSREFLNQLPAPTADQPDPEPLPPPPGIGGHLFVIIQDIEDLRPFAGERVDWLIRVARLMFEPLGNSHLFTFTGDITEDTVQLWINMDMVPAQWRQVQQGEPLRPTIYEFRPNNNAPITLSKMSARQSHSVTTNTSQPHADAFRDAIRARDTRCIITGHPRFRAVTASHLIPKRLGDVAIRSVVQRFTGLDASGVTRFDPRLGVLLVKHMDSMVDFYELGFWHSGPDQYVVHDFSEGEPLNLFGFPLALGNGAPLHGHLITLPTNNPPIGIFNWNYLQCVLTRFATPNYREFENIRHFSLPFRTREEEEDEESDFDFDDERNIANPPYPSYLIELAEARERQRLEDEERNRAIAAWSSKVSTH
ncbi:hypothetical protein F5887DRAFT_1160371 [Amanita rubescens]|nr:hypothetical protein F5887DRAFT_1160371 [Amanita rubescens]